MAERQFGPYKLIRQIAVGGMAEIHLAKTGGIAGFEKYVALKMIHPNFAEDEQFIQMLVDEAKIAVQLTHGNIAQTFDLGRVGDTYYITMEYVDGADLYKILRRASEQDLEMPLDVCAFIGKEVASALDHAHRKRDHAGKSLGIVHRDVSPQNVLVSFSGEVKLVDFGIAKATMKVRQTAAGVIKGKYYYMSPEQAWGDPIDHRSDIFSAGIVLYEMLTGQMLYLEEDLHKLLEMARRADIAPPSRVRKGVPPQLERIVMHALEKVPGERYQSASDLATDLERFLHAYSPVFTASKLGTLVRQVIGDPIQVPDDPDFQGIEFRDGGLSTHPLADSEVAHATDRDGFRDENSVLFRVSELDKSRAGKPAASWSSSPARASAPPASRAGAAPPARPGTPPPVRASAAPSVRASAAPSGRASGVPASAASSSPSGPAGAPRQIAPRVTRAADPLPAPSPPVPPSGGKLPSIVASRGPSKPPAGKPRQAHEETRQLDQAAPPNPLHDDTSGLLTPDGVKLTWAESDRWDTSDEDLDNFGERTVITGAPGMPGGISGFSAEGLDSVGDATVITTTPPSFGAGGSSRRAPTEDDAAEDDATHALDFGLDRPGNTTRPKAAPPPALAAKIHVPAVSELRKPRASRRTPAGGSPVTPNVLQAIVGSRPSEPMPIPRPTTPPTPAVPPPPPRAATHRTPPSGTSSALPPGSAPPASPARPPSAPGAASPAAHHATVAMPPPAQPGAAPTMIASPPGNAYASPFGFGASAAPSASYGNDASGLPLGLSTPPGMSAHATPGAYPVLSGAQPGYAAPPQAPSYPAMPPGAPYPFQPPQPISLSGQMRLLDGGDLPSQYKLGATRRRWLTYILSGLLAVAVAAGATFLIIRSTRQRTPTTGSVHLESVPAGAEVVFDGTRLVDRTPLTIDGAPVGSHHTIRLELPHYKPYVDTVDIPKTGREIAVMAQLQALTGKLLVNTTPAGAEIRIHGQLRGVTPTTINGIDIESTQAIELRHKDFSPREVPLKWDADGLSYVDFRFTRPGQ